MIGELDFPAVDASLNALSALLLMTGYAAIRRRRITLHKTCMLSALVVSGLFLLCYLYYHLIVRHGAETQFLGQGWIRPVYFSLLISHIVLAVIVLLLAPLTAYCALRGQLKRHVRIARWTLPIWLYVSVTGVIVYGLLYQVAYD